MMQTEINEYWLQDVIKNIRNETLDVAPEILIKGARASVARHCGRGLSTIR